MAKRLVEDDHNIVYVADSTVYHLHGESWQQIRRRYEREAIALQRIMPEVHIHFTDFLRYWMGSVTLDLKAALKRDVFWEKAVEIVRFRFAQFFGTYRGNLMHRELSRSMKERYFYPDVKVTKRN